MGAVIHVGAAAYAEDHLTSSLLRGGSEAGRGQLVRPLLGRRAHSHASRQGELARKASRSFLFREELCLIPSFCEVNLGHL